MLIELTEGEFLVNLGNHSFGTGIPVSVYGIDLLVTLEQHVVHTPGVYRQTFNLGELTEALLDTGDHALHQGGHIPDQVSVLLLDTVGETEGFFGLKLAVFHPGNDVPTGGSADVNRKEISHYNHLSLKILGWFSPSPKNRNYTLSL